MNTKSIINKIILVNIIVFVLWTILPLQFMYENFLISSESLLEGRIWTVLTSVFSHNMLFHLVINMFVLSGFGKVMEEILGPRSFLTFYIVAGIGGSLGHCYASSILLHAPEIPALGASGAVSGVLIIFSFLFPKHIVYLFGIIPLPSLLATILFVGADLMGLIAQTNGNSIPIGFGAHLGGAITGFVYWIFMLRPSQGSSSSPVIP